MTDAFICDAVRTPIGRYAGALSAVRADDLAAVPIRALMARHKRADWAALDDVILGSGNQAGEDNRNVARMASLLAGLDAGVAGSTVNRLCGSGMEAIAVAARAVRSGDQDFLLAGGVESMSRAPFVMGKADTAFGRNHKLEDTTLGWRFVNPALKKMYGVDTMPETGENVAEQFQIARADQDAFALRSQLRAKDAIAAGRIAEEIVGVSVPGGKQGPRIVDTDEHPRPETTLEGLAKLPTPFRDGGTITAGNASGINDGAAALIVASEAAARRHGLQPMARILACATAGVEPRIMGIGPVPATQKLLARTGLKLADFDVIELNEAFASQVLAVLRQLGLPDDAAQVNPNGGAIAYGHPVGMSGARLVTTATRELRRRKGRYALCTMCIGVGQGIALAIERI